MDLLTFNEAAQVAGISVKTIHRHISRGKLETVDTPMGKRISQDSLAPYLRLRRDLPEQEGTDEDARERTVEDQDGRLTGQEETPQETEVDREGRFRTQSDTVPLVAHLAALELAQKALERAEQRFESQLKSAEEQRNRAEFAERQRLALEFQLQQYQLALTEQSEALAEARAEKKAAQAQLAETTVGAEVVYKDNVQSIDVAPRISMPKPSFGQRLKNWLGLRQAQ